MLIDSHCHLTYLMHQHADSLDVILKNAKDVGVSRILNICVTLKEFPEVLKITQQYPDDLLCSVGLQPSERDKTFNFDRLVECANHKEVVAIGECGLDYYYDFVSQEQQRENFRIQIQAAKKVKKPLIIHTREADKDLVNIINEEGARDVGAVMHCFTGDRKLSNKMLGLGFYISFSGIVTFKQATQLQEVAKNIPKNRILIETDAPYLSPEPKRGKMNEPAYLKYTAEFLAQLRHESFEAFSEQTTQNFNQLFIEKPQQTP